MAAYAKVTLFAQDRNQRRGRASESYYVDGTDPAKALAWAGALQVARADLLGYGAVAGPVRVTIYNADPVTGVLTKTLTMPVIQDLVQPNAIPGFALSGPNAWAAAASMRGGGIRLNYKWVGNSVTNHTLPFIPYILTMDRDPDIDYSGSLQSTMMLEFAKRIGVYNTRLRVGNASAPLTAKRRTRAYPLKVAIVTVTKDSDGNPCVILVGDQTSVFPAGLRVKVGARIMRRRISNFKRDPLNADFTVSASTFDPASGRTTVCLSCGPRGFDFVCLSRNGYIAPIAYSFLDFSALALPSTFGFPRRPGRVANVA